MGGHTTTGTSRRLAWMFAMAILCGAGVGAWLARGSWTQVALSPVGSAELVKALGGLRLFKPRLSGFDGYRPCSPLELRCSPVPEPGSEIFERLRRLRHRGVAGRDFRASGLWLLALANGGRQVERAVAELEEAVAAGVAGAALYTDLAAAHLLRAEANGDSTGYLPALRFADLAITADPSHQAALFNRALALTGLQLRTEARRAWTEYAAVEEDPAWLREAEDLRRAVEPLEIAVDLETRLLAGGERMDRAWARQLVAESPQEVQDFLELEQFASWTGAGPRDAAARLAVLGYLADAVAEATGDDFFVDALGTVENLAPDARGHLADAHLRYSHARALYDERKLDQALRGFARSESAFDDAGSPFAGLARYYRAVCLYFLGDLDKAQLMLGALRQQAEPRGYRRLLGYIDWMSGLAYTSGGEIGAGISRYREAVRSFTTTRSSGQAAFVRVLLADAMIRLGEPERAWGDLYPALAAVYRLSSPNQARALWERSAEISDRLGFGDVSLYFHREALDAARRSGQPVVICEALAGRAAARLAAGSVEGAREDLEEARSWLAAIDDPAMARLVEAVVARVESREMAAREQASPSLARLTAAIESTTAAGTMVLLPELLLDRGRLLLAAGDHLAAERDWLRSVEVAERQLPEVSAAVWRQSFRASKRVTIEALITLYLGLGKPAEEIVPWTDRLHDADSFYTASSGEAEIDWPERLSTPVTGDIAITSWTVLDDRVVVWVLRSGSLSLVQIPVARSQLATLVDSSLATSATSSRLSRVELHRLLIAPIAAEIRGAQTLVLVLDDLLGQLSFAALEDSAGGYLVEEHALVRVPAAWLALRPDGRPRQELDSVFVVADPALGGDRRKTLPALSAAIDEAHNVARMYPRWLWSSREEATRETVLQHLPAGRVFHFSGHGIANLEFPEQSRLVLAGDTEERPVGLFANDLRRLDLSEVEVAVLAACEVARSRMADGSGTLTLAAPLLAAGVGTVVASAEEIDDGEGQLIFTSFHRALLEGASPAEALRTAQLEFLRQENGPRTSYWSGIRVITTRGFGSRGADVAVGARPP